MSSDDKKLKQAFDNSKYTWRTVRGISKETGLNRESITGYIYAHGDDLVKSSSRNKRGELLFSSRKKYREKSGVLKRISSAMKNRGG